MRVAGKSLVPLLLAVAAGACGFDGAGSRGAAASGDGSTLADATTAGSLDGAGDAVGDDAHEGGDLDGGDGSVLVDAPPAPYTLRVTSGLLALYEFEENAGLTAHDSVAPAANLTIRDAVKAVWKPHALTFADYTQADTAPIPLSKVFAACKISSEVTVEAWIESGLVNKDVHTRIVTMAMDNSNLDFALGTDTTDGMWAAVQANQNLTPSTKLTAALTHFVMTRTASDSTLRIYINGTKLDELTPTASPASWADQALYVGNGSAGDRGWRGSIHLLAVYGRALTAAEIATNHSAGADP